MKDGKNDETPGASPEGAAILCIVPDRRHWPVLRQGLTRPGIELHLTDDANEGLNLAVTRPVAMVFCSLGSRQSGNDLLGRIREVSPDTVRVMLTAETNTVSIIEAVNKSEVWKCLREPPDPEELGKVAAEGLALWHRRRGGAFERPAGERTDQHQQVLREIAEVMARPENPDFVLHATTNILASALNFDAITILLWDDRRKLLVMRAASGLRFEADKAPSRQAAEGLVGFVFSTRRPLVAVPASSHPAWLEPPPGMERFEAFLGAPILLGDQIFGVLCAHARDHRSIPATETAFFQFVASRLAGVLRLAGKMTNWKDLSERRHAARVFQGRGVSAGFAVGRVHLVKGLFKEVSLDHLRFLGKKQETEHLRKAVKEAARQQKKIIDEFSRKDQLSQEELRIFKAHSMLIKDDATLQLVLGRIEQKKLTAEQAVVETFEGIAGQFENHENRYLKERAQDFRDIGERILKILLGFRAEPAAQEAPAEGEIIVAHDLGPSFLASFNARGVAAIVTETGGATSHISILAKSLGLPAVCGVENICNAVKRGETLLVDGKTGLVFLEPAKALVEEYRKSGRKQARLRAAVEKQLLTEEPSKIPVKVSANIGLTADVELAARHQVADVGLYRTEVSFMRYDRFPTVLEQFWIYQNVGRKFSGQVTVRTLDIGADKMLPYFAMPREDNPLLGLRSIRFSMEYLDIFRDQLRAILLAQKQGCRFRVLLPMVTSLWEVETARDILNQLGQELYMEPSALPPLGLMAEVPAVILQLEDYRDLISFVSVGTNDLAQYTLAVDRTSSAVGQLYSDFHPAVIRLVHQVFEKAKACGLEASACGEMAGNPAGALALLALGCPDLSMAPARIPLLRLLLSRLDPALLPEIARTLLAARRESEIREYLTAELEKIDPMLRELE